MAFEDANYRHPQKTTYTHAELAEDLKDVQPARVSDPTPVPATQDGSVPSAPGPEFVYTEGWDKGNSGPGDPYGISEYTDQSANPDAAQKPKEDKSESEKSEDAKRADEIAEALPLPEAE